MVATLGEKLKYFRKRSKFSQLILEVEIDASPGSISRFKSNKVKPGRETLIKISKALNLNKFEIDYLYGSLAQPASEEELVKAINDVKEYFSKKGVLGYLTDDRYRLIAASKDFSRLLKLTQEEVSNILFKPLVQVMLDPKLKVFDYLNNEDLESTVKSTLNRYYFEAGFYTKEPSHITALKYIQKNPIAKKVWEEIVMNPPSYINTLESRNIKFSVSKMDFSMTYSIEQLSSNHRFAVIEYTPTNKIINLLNKLF